LLATWGSGLGLDVTRCNNEARMRFVLLIGIWLAMGLVSAQSTAADDVNWKAFLQWLNAQPPNSKPADLVNPYRDKLLRDGVPEREVTRRMEMIWWGCYHRPDGVGPFWSKIFGGDHPIFSEQPTALVVSAIEGRKPGRALDFGMGQGRNAVFLALQGWDVTGFDPAEEAVRIANKNAEGAGVKIHGVVARDDQFDFGTAQWDLIVVTYVRDLTAHDAAIFQRALKSAGIVVYENGSSPGNEVLKAFLGFRIVHYEDVEAVSDWNREGKQLVQRLIAEKRAK
jgi:2-polyprenyl-3-methyl-5-hydroxy-6-metoxy-1,4-benzoquinol methylase